MMIVLIGASASGKTEIAKNLVTHFNYQKCITTTTRAMRPLERDGIDYHFISKAEFIRLKQRDAFLEVTEYNGNFYGLQKKDAVQNGVVIVDPNGANVLIQTMKDDAFIVLVQADEHIRRERMMARGDLVNQINRRLIIDRDIFKPEYLTKIDLILLNNGDQSIFSISQFVHEQYQRYLNHCHEQHESVIEVKC